MTDQPMTGRVALVAGASKGIGAATAEAFAAAGAAVVLAARDKDALTSVAARIQAAGGRATAVPADVADTESMQSLVEQTVARYGRLDTAFNNATDGPLPAPLADIDVAAFGHFRRPNYAARVVRPAADGWYPGRRGRHARDPWPVLVEMSGAWPGRPLPPWPPAQPGVPTPLRQAVASLAWQARKALDDAQPATGRFFSGATGWSSATRPAACAARGQSRSPPSLCRLPPGFRRGPA